MMVLATQQRNSPHFYHICCNLSVWMMFLAEYQRCSPHLIKYLLQRCSWQRGKRKWSDSIQSLPLPLTTITVRGNRLRFVRYLTKWDKIYNTHSKVRPWLIFFKRANFCCCSSLKIDENWTGYKKMSFFETSRVRWQSKCCLTKIQFHVHWTICFTPILHHTSVVW